MKGGLYWGGERAQGGGAGESGAGESGAVFPGLQGREMGEGESYDKR